MAMNNPQQVYKQNSVMTASPGELTLLLYNGCLKFINRAKKAIQEKNIQERNENLIKAQNIIQELMVTLNTDVEISKGMMQMYDYIHRRLVEANMKNDLEVLEEAEGYVVQFRDAWKEVLKESRKQYAESGRV